MNDYLLGTDILGAGSTISVTNVTPVDNVSTFSSPSSPVLQYGPPMPAQGVGPTYTDKDTITAVQKKLKALGYFPYTVNGKFGPQTDAAILHYTASYGPAQHGPPNDALLARLGLSSTVSFSDDEVDTMVVQAKTATTPAQVKIVAAKIEQLAPPELKQEAAAAVQAAATASTPVQQQAAQVQVQAVAEKVQAAKGMPAWKIGVIAAGSAVAVGLVVGLITRIRATRA
jgi:peptidoglycan hydrolase-like protein with peptidoglycan-binding domain